MSKRLRTWRVPVRRGLGAAVDRSQWECWDEGKLCAKASCLGESGAVMGVLVDVWGGREG